MVNVLWAILYLIITFSITIVVYKIGGKEGLFIWICISIILTNIQSVKYINIFGLTTCMGNIAYSNIFLATDILNEFEGKKEANKSVVYGLFAMITFTTLMSLSLLFEPNSFDTAQDSLINIFTIVPRITIASITAFLVSQFLDVYIFAKLKQRYNKLWLSNNISTILSQILDTMIFAIIAFVGTMPFEELMIMAGTMYLIKLIIAIIDTGFIYTTKYLKNKQKDKKNGNNL